MEEQKPDLFLLLRSVRKHSAAAVCLPLLTLAVSIFITFFITHPVYRATSMVIVGQKAEGQGSRPLEYTAILANQQLAKTYETIAKSRTVLERVAHKLEGGLSPEQLIKQISVEAVKNTEVIAISASDTDPQRAAAIANQLTAEFANRIVEVKHVDSVGLVDSAAIPAQPVKPNKALNLALGLFFGILSAALWIFILEQFDNSVHTAEDAESLTGVPVLGVIPYFKQAPNTAK